MKCKCCGSNEITFTHFKRHEGSIWFDEYYECEKCGSVCVLNIMNYKVVSRKWYYKKGGNKK